MNVLKSIINQFEESKLSPKGIITLYEYVPKELRKEEHEYDEDDIVCVLEKNGKYLVKPYLQ